MSSRTFSPIQLYRIAAFAAQYREALRTELGAEGRCPVCILNFMDLETEDACQTGTCVYDHDGPTAERDARRLWIRDVLREAYRKGGIALHERWRSRFDPTDVDTPSTYRWIFDHADDYEGLTEDEINAINDLLKQSAETE
jgi:hypothetical protein